MLHASYFATFDLVSCRYNADVEDFAEAEIQDLQDQLDQARLVISQLAGQADNNKALQRALAGQLT